MGLIDLDGRLWSKQLAALWHNGFPYLVRPLCSPQFLLVRGGPDSPHSHPFLPLRVVGASGLGSLTLGLGIATQPWTGGPLHSEVPAPFLGALGDEAEDRASSLRRPLLPPSAFLLLALFQGPLEPVRFGAGLDDVSPVGNAIQQGLAQPRVGKDLGPFGKRQIRGKD
jgi:hypothetical protein